MELTSSEKQTLLEIARCAIQFAVRGELLPPLSATTKNLEKPSGVFVTLLKEDILRGCIGYIEPAFPLALATQEVAAKAAMEDPRFMPVTEDELDQIRIEISVLSELQPCTDIGTIEIGKHGLVMDDGFRRGLLLPQVAIEYGWTREQFLEHTAIKAGIEPNAWKSGGVKIYTFTVDLFSE